MSVIKVKNNGKWETIPIIGSTSGSGVGKVDSNSDGTGEIFNDYVNNIASGLKSHSEGNNNKAIGLNAHAEGSNNTTTGSASHVEGNNNKVGGKYAHAEGYKNTANGEASHVEGTSCYSTGMNSHAEGNNTSASGDFTHSEGKYTAAIGVAAHSEGIRDISSGSEFFGTHLLLMYLYNNQLHAENLPNDPVRLNSGSIFLCNGIVYRVINQLKFSVSLPGTTQYLWILETSPDLKENIQLSSDYNNPTTVTIEPVIEEGAAKGKASHHQNTNNCAYGDNSYAGGQGCQSNNSLSFTHGLGLIASTDNLAVFGKYNKYVPGDIFEVGIGTGKGEKNRENAFRIDENGDAYFHYKILSSVADISVIAGTNLGINNSATIRNKFTCGLFGNTITGLSSGIIGCNNNISESYSVAFGYGNTVSGDYSGAIGKDCKVDGSSATSLGLDCRAYGNQSHAEGYQTLAIGNYSHAEGGSAVKVDESFYTKTNDEIIAEWKRLYETPTVYETGDGFSMAKGKGSHSEGKNTLALGNYSHAEGEKTIARGHRSRSGGYNTEAMGGGSFTFGVATDSEFSSTIISAQGDCSLAGGLVMDDLGIYANGAASLAFGYVGMGGSIKANGDGSIAIGFGYGNPIQSNGKGSVAFNVGTISDNYAQTSIGCNNTEDSNPSPSFYNSEKVAFVIGNGTSSENRGNAFKVLFNGQTYADGAYSGSGADYAEFFEWQDGNTDNEDRVGLFVSLNGDKIVKADFSSSYVLGVVSGNPTIIGDNPMRWKNKYLTDEWGRPIYEDVEVKYIETKVDENGETSRVEKTRIDHIMKLNPEWDSSLEYKSREVRPEWSAIGMMGKLLVRQDGTLNAGEFCYPNADGIATKSESGYYVMKVMSENLALILFK